jgi:uncharacterized LabA/DUF88 family protein
MKGRFAILLDGGFVTKKLTAKLKNFPKPEDIEKECQRVSQHPTLQDRDLLRIYFYDAPPANETLKNPIDGSSLNLAATPHFRQYTSLIDALEMKPNFAVRRGEVVVHGWRLGSKAFETMVATPRPPAAQDIVPNVEQKGVDLRIGLDIARLSLREMVDIIVVVTGDSDLVPAFRFARREGIRVYLDHLGHGVRRDLKAHADIVL